MTTEKCLAEQLYGDVRFDGVNDIDVWLEVLCFAEIVALCECPCGCGNELETV